MGPGEAGWARRCKQREQLAPRKGWDQGGAVSAVGGGGAQRELQTWRGWQADLLADPLARRWLWGADTGRDEAVS